MSYIIACDGNDYYGGKTYIYQGSYFADRVRRHEAKVYKSKKIAENVVKTLSRKCDGYFHVIENQD